jgi:hypothetical protein
MKKIIIGLSGLVILAFAVILFTNAQTSKKDTNKPATEVSKDCAACPSAATCPEATATKAAACDMTKCTEGKCDPATCKDGKCDPATCKKCTDKNCEAKAGNAAKCAACPEKAVVK